MTTFTVGECLREALGNIGAVKSGQCDNAAGSTTSIRDLIYRTADEVLEQFLGGTIFITHTTDGAAPLFEFSTVTGYSSQTFAIVALAAAVEDGDRYAVASPYYNVPKLLELMNDALRKVGTVPLEDTSITILAGVSEYTLPTGVSQDLRSVDIQTHQEALDNNWTPILNYDLITDTHQGAAKIMFGGTLEEGMAIRLKYHGNHATVDAFDDIIDESIPRNLIGLQLTKELENYKATSQQHANKFANKGADKAKRELLIEAQKNPVRKHKKQGRSKMAGA